MNQTITVNFDGKYSTRILYVENLYEKSQTIVLTSHIVPGMTLNYKYPVRCRGD